MRKPVAIAVLTACTVLGGLGVRSALAHECPGGDTTSPGCEPTAVYGDYRPNYIPLFDLRDRDQQGEDTDGEQQRYDAQRWRAQCSGNTNLDDTPEAEDEQQMCAWARGGTSGSEYGSDGADGPRPNELHLGFAASHCFLHEGFHDCNTHGGETDTGDDGEWAAHDSHGGATYVDACLAQNGESHWCDDGMADTQAGVTIVDHLGCFPIGCFDEYHVVRPLDEPYTEDQMNDTATAIPGILDDPAEHLWPGADPVEG